MRNFFDVIAIGVGAMGSAAAAALAKRGLRVLGLEQFTTPNDRGSSHGSTRIIRKAYFEHPDYVPLLHDAYRLWSEIESDTGAALFHRVGLLLIGCRDGVVIPGVRRSALAHQLDIRDVSQTELNERFPMFAMPEDYEALWEQDAGYLRVEDCVRAMAELAQRRGAVIECGQRVTGWTSSANEICVTTERETYRAAKLIICGGAWSGRMLSELALPLEIRRKVQLWYACEPRRFTPSAGTPVFAYDLPDGFFYGFPENERGEAKISEHTGRQVVTDADALDRELRAADTERVTSFVSRYVRGVNPRVMRHSVCMYAMTPDEHFIIDKHPLHANVAFAAGFSGHGFKFAPIVGEVLANLAANGETSQPAEFLRLASRFPTALPLRPG